eukprot:566442-Pelagomonas_calceolata.AAC.12
MIYDSLQHEETPASAKTAAECTHPQPWLGWREGRIPPMRHWLTWREGRVFGHGRTAADGPHLTHDNTQKKICTPSPCNETQAHSEGSKGQIVGPALQHIRPLCPAF